MRDALSRAARPYVGRGARLRWLHLVLGGAVLMPYYLVALTVVDLVDGRQVGYVGLWAQPRAYGLSLLLVASTAFFSLVRTFEVSAARLLLGERATSLTPGPPTSRGGRFRAAVWYVVHLAVGGVASALTLALPPATVVLLARPFVDLRPAAVPDAWPVSVPDWLQPLAGLLLLAALLGVVRAGGGLARLAPALLGPSPSDRLAELERRTARLAERNRLARDLHDSVGHALSVVTIQAGAAGRLIDSDPVFAARALGAIEETARSALADLDHVLGLLRDEASSSSTPVPDLAGLDRLLDQARLGGLAVDTEVAGDPAVLPAVVSREAYRIVQEGLTNALRHAGAVPVRLRIDVRPSVLTLELTNTLVAGRSPVPGGGRGLAGIAERVASLGGQVSAGADGARWRVAVEVPL